MNAELPVWKASRFGSSCEVVIAGSAASEVESRPITSSARVVGSSSSESSSGPESTWPPADSTIWLNQTTSPSYLFAWTWIRFSSGLRLSASSIISSQVFGGCLTRSERYQSSSVFDHSGAAYSVPSNLAVSSTLGKTSLETTCAVASGTGTIQPALANSPVQITSMPIRSIVSSSAPSRRTSCSRWPSASAGRNSNSISYSPPDSFAHFSAAVCGEALGSLKMNQVSVLEPPASSPPQPPNAIVAAATARARNPLLVRPAANVLLSPGPLRTRRSLNCPGERVRKPPAQEPVRRTTTAPPGRSAAPSVGSVASTTSPETGVRASRSPRLTATACSPRR